MSKSLCTFERCGDACRCSKCDRVVPADDCAKLMANCVVPARDPLVNQCVHFLGMTGENIKAKKDCGCQTAKPMTATAECELHGLCTVVQPAADDSIHCCQTCPDYSPSG